MRGASNILSSTHKSVFCHKIEACSISKLNFFIIIGKHFFNKIIAQLIFICKKRKNKMRAK